MHTNTNGFQNLIALIVGFIIISPAYRSLGDPCNNMLVQQLFLFAYESILLCR